jgi:hypothetical protein
VKNVIQVEEIKKMLINEPDLSAMFDLLIIITNNRLNNESFTKVLDAVVLEVEDEINSQGLCAAPHNNSRTSPCPQV